MEEGIYNEEEYKKVRSFYVDTLKLSVVKECDTCILLDTRAGIEEIFRDGTESLEKGIIRHFAFAVDDVQTCVDAVESAGYEVFIAPKNVQIGGDSAYSATIAFCYGPLGEEIEFFCQEW
jgi:glyoxylase I family protein